MTLEEQSCPTVIAGLRAAAQGVPFMPLAGMTGSDLVPGRFLAVANEFLIVSDEEFRALVG